MQENHNNDSPSFTEDEINLQELFYILIKRKWIIFTLTTFFSIAGVLYSLSLPNIYQSKALLSPVDSSTSLSGSLQNVSSLAGLAGISLPSVGPKSNKIKAINKLNSLSFFKNNIQPNIFLPDLMAIKSWDYVENVISYDENIYNAVSNSWVRKFEYPKKQIPSSQESFKIFQKLHMNVVEDKKTGFVTLSVKHQSPFVAKQWVELIVNEVNIYFRQKDKLESQKSAAYLNQQISKTNLSEVKQAIAEILQQETQKLALIEATEYYVFDYIDPPVVMEKKSSPTRAIICILAAFLGAALGIIMAFLAEYRTKDQD